MQITENQTIKERCHNKYSSTYNIQPQHEHILMDINHPAQIRDASFNGLSKNHRTVSRSLNVVHHCMFEYQHGRISSILSRDWFPGLRALQRPLQSSLFLLSNLILIPCMIIDHEVSCSLYIVISCCLKYRLSSSSTNTRFKKYFTLNLLLMLWWVGVSS